MYPCHDSRRMRAAIVDLDGTVYRSETPVEGAASGIAALRAAGVDVVFVSNTSTKSRETCRRRLERIGIDATASDVITSASVAADYVAADRPEAVAMAVGQPALLEELRRAGVTLTDDPDAAEVVVVGKDRSFDFDTLTRAARAIEAGAAFVATNRDGRSPVDGGIEPGTGSLVAAVAAAADREPDAVAGKPHGPIVDRTLDRLGVEPADCLVVGDNPAMDVAMGERAGMRTLLVLSGIADRTDDWEVRPDHVVETIGEVTALPFVPSA